MSKSLPLATSIDLMASIFDSKNEVEFSSSLSTATRRCGFETFVLGLEVTGPDGTIKRHVTSAYPIAWQKIYAEKSYAAHDPTVAHCLSQNVPVIWSESIFEHTRALPIWEEARSYGIGYGMSIPVHERIGTKSMLSLARDRPWGDDEREKAELLAAAQILSSCAHVVVSRLIFQEFIGSQRPSLTSQETACLRWVAQGKTSWEIGKLMHISDPTVVFHLKNLMKKLNVVNRAQALAVAIRLGLIS